MKHKQNDVTVRQRCINHFMSLCTYYGFSISISYKVQAINNTSDSNVSIMAHTSALVVGRHKFIIKPSNLIRDY